MRQPGTADRNNSTDQIGQFPITSARGNAYIMILYDFDSNAILARAIKSQKKEDLIAGFTYLHKQLTDAGIHPVLHKLDNEVSGDLIEEIKECKMDFQLSPPGNHRTLLSERAIQTWKNNFQSVLEGLDNCYPTNQWDRLVEPATKILNML